MKVRRKGGGVELVTRRATFFVGRLGKGFFVGKADYGALEERLMEAWARCLKPDTDVLVGDLLRKVEKLRDLYAQKLAAEQTRIHSNYEVKMRQGTAWRARDDNRLPETED